MLSTKELNAIKREYNTIMAEGRPLYARLEELTTRAEDIQRLMVDEDPDVAIAMIFGDDAPIDEGGVELLESAAN